jgi:hypothetical protein
MPMPEAKAAVERLVDRQQVTVYLPMLEDAARFESEMRALGIGAVKQTAAAAAEG